MSRGLSFLTLAASTLTSFAVFAAEPAKAPKAAAPAKPMAKAKAAPAAKPAEPAKPGENSVVVQKLPALNFGLTGYAGTDEAKSNAVQIQNFLTEKMGRDVITRIYPNPGALAWGLAIGEVDLGWLQPLTVVEAQKKGAVTLIAKVVRHGLPFYRGVIFTKSSRDVQGLAGLKGLSVAWVDPKSAAGYLFPRAEIVEAGLKPAELFKSESFAGDHGAVCRAVVSGKADVGATYADDRPGTAMAIDGCVQSVGAAVAKELKIVSKSQPIPNDAIAARPGLDPVEIDRLKKVFLELGKDHAGQRVLLSVFKATAFDVVGDDDFTPVRFAADAAEASQGKEAKP